MLSNKILVFDRKEIATHPVDDRDDIMEEGDCNVGLCPPRRYRLLEHCLWLGQIPLSLL